MFALSSILFSSFIQNGCEVDDMSKKNKQRSIFIGVAAILVLALVSITVLVQNSKATETKEEAYVLPVASSQDVTELDYSNYEIDSVSNVYNPDIQSQIQEQLSELEASTQATVTDPLLVSNPYLTNRNSVYVNFKTTK